jgi:uridine kinase
MTTIVAVDGCGAAGKSVFAQRLGAALSCPIVHTDDFASWNHPLDWHERAVDELFTPLAAGRRAVFRATDWIHGAVGDFVTVEAAPTVIVEGVASSRRAFDRFLAFRIWIDAPRDERLRRGIERDAAHWTSPRDIRQQWLEWMRAEDDYVANERPDELADLVVNGDPRVAHDPASEYVAFRPALPG